MSDRDEHEQRFRPTPEQWQCPQCGADLSQENPPEPCQCGHEACQQCLKACDFCGYEGCPSCITETEEGENICTSAECPGHDARLMTVGLRMIHDALSRKDERDGEETH